LFQASLYEQAWCEQAISAGERRIVFGKWFFRSYLPEIGRRVLDALTM